MPVTVTILDNPRVKLWQITLPITPDEYLIAVEKSREEPEQLDALCDLREVPVGEMGVEMVKLIAKRLGGDSATARANTSVAVVVNRAVDFGVARMYSSFAGDREQVFRIFYDMDEATAWLSSLSA